MSSAPLSNVLGPLPPLLRKWLPRFQRLGFAIWNAVPWYSPVLIILAGYAVWQARTPVIIIVPFQLKGALPFSGDIVADALQDSLASIHNDIESERQDRSLRSFEISSANLRHMVIPKFGRVQGQGPTRFAVEVKGWSYETILSLARSVLRTETTISGDVIVNGSQFILIARTADAGPWESIASPMNIEGLKQASRDLAEKILAARDPVLAATALLADGQPDQALALLNRVRSRNPRDVRATWNLCLAFRASRRYEEAINCYDDLEKMNTRPSRERSEWLAQVYYLKGDRERAIKDFKRLADQGYRNALLGLGEVLDANGQPGDAVKEYDKFIALEPDERSKAIAYVNRGTALAHSDKNQEALADYEEALKFAPGDVLVLVFKGVEVAKAGNLDLGVAELQSVTDGNENADSLPFAFLQLGTLLQEKGDWQRAVAEFRKATELQPNYAEAHVALANALAHEGRRSEALSEYTRIARLSNSEFDRTYPEFIAHQWLGNTLRDQGDDVHAASAYREAIRLEPEFGMAHCWLGFVLERQGYLSEAVQQYRAASSDVNSRAFSDTGWRVVAKNRLHDALLKEARAQRAGQCSRSSECSVESHPRSSGMHRRAQRLLS